MCATTHTLALPLSKFAITALQGDRVHSVVERVIVKDAILLADNADGTLVLVVQVPGTKIVRMEPSPAQETTETRIAWSIAYVPEPRVSGSFLRFPR